MVVTQRTDKVLIKKVWGCPDGWEEWDAKCVKKKQECAQYSTDGRARCITQKDTVSEQMDKIEKLVKA
jgi:hypothetical protein